MVLQKIILFVFVLMQSFLGIAWANSSNEYHPVTFENLSKTYWYLSIHDISDNKAVDEFARIHFCDVYQNYYLDDFQWERIRQSIKDRISTHKSVFPMRFSNVTPIYIDRYDFSEQAYLLDEKSQFRNVNKIYLMDENQFDGYCGLENPVSLYPGRVTLELKKGFSFDAIPMTQREANDLLQYFKEENSGQRVLWMHIKFRVTGFRNSGPQYVPNYNLLGTLERVEIYKDQAAEELLFNIDVTKTSG